ncbi:fimbrial-like protein [[Enterobacter] lignolyticus]|uniref:Fimbrial protein domain-containing protein n=1 Tax=Enterobacter lignolyticus (strain SCF1) TaxID=701347 RepID=E3G3B1_ENTLS|nr:fimbrial-like protein [[Enterobacter] lignolyticus]ADO46988.1 Fimbrial protein domain-containing protein [[Enterobacter] lignolyticus SCF1]
MFNKTLLAAVTATLMVGASFNASADDNQGSGKITFTGEVISAPCSIAPGDEDQTIKLGEVADTVLNTAGQYSLPVPVTIHLQDCILSDGTNTIDKVKVTFTSPGVDATDPNLMKNTYEGNVGGASGVGVRLLDAGSNKVTLGTPVTVAFTTTNAYQELNFQARMESLTNNATPGNLKAQANYVLDYK